VSHQREDAPRPALALPGWAFLLAAMRQPGSRMCCGAPRLIGAAPNEVWSPPTLLYITPSCVPSFMTERDHGLQTADRETTLMLAVCRPWSAVTGARWDDPTTWVILVRESSDQPGCSGLVTCGRPTRRAASLRRCEPADSRWPALLESPPTRTRAERTARTSIAMWRRGASYSGPSLVFRLGTPRSGSSGSTVARPRLLRNRPSDRGPCGTCTILNTRVNIEPCRGPSSENRLRRST